MRSQEELKQVGARMTMVIVTALKPYAQKYGDRTIAGVLLGLGIGMFREFGCTHQEIFEMVGLVIDTGDKAKVTGVIDINEVQSRVSAITGKSRN